MNNTIIIGNGFDRQIGLKTDYNSFLDWIEAKGEYFEDLFVEGANLFKNWVIETNHEFNDEWIDFFFNLIVSHNEKNTNAAKGFIDRIIRSYGNGNVFLNGKRNILIQFLLEYSNRKIFNTTENKSNVWFSYFNYLRRYRNKHKNLIFKFDDLVNVNANWIDLETLICKNIIHLIEPTIFGNNTFTIKEFTESVVREELDEQQLKTKLWNDFLKLKILLTEFVKYQEATYKSFIGHMKYNFDSFYKLAIQNVINFNYSNCFWESYNNFSKRKSFIHKNIYYVHGTQFDGNEIVFGFDSFLSNEEVDSKFGRKSSKEVKILEDEFARKFTKVYQLLQLQKNKPKFEIGIINKLYILGHSIGEQDYNYFFSILDKNIEHIEIIYLWYYYNNGLGSNKISGQTALFDMLNAYERYANIRVLHKMIFEGRIKFEEVSLNNTKEN